MTSSAESLRAHEDFDRRIDVLEERVGSLEKSVASLVETAGWLKSKSKWAALAFMVVELAIAGADRWLQ